MKNDKAIVVTESFVDAARDTFLSKEGKEYVNASREVLYYTNRRLDELAEIKLKDKDEQIDLLRKRFAAAEKFAIDENAPIKIRVRFYDEMESINTQINAFFDEKRRIAEARETELKHCKKMAEFGTYAVPAIIFAAVVMQAILTASAGKKA